MQQIEWQQLRKKISFSCLAFIFCSLLGKVCYRVKIYNDRLN